MTSWIEKGSEEVKMTAEEVKHASGLKLIEIFFDETSPSYCVDPEINLMFVRGVVNYTRDVQRVRGVTFLNDMLDNLGLPRLRAGQTAGWWHTDVDVVTGRFGRAITLSCWVEDNVHHAFD